MKQLFTILIAAAVLAAAAFATTMTSSGLAFAQTGAPEAGPGSSHS